MVTALAQLHDDVENGGAVAAAAADSLSVLAHHQVAVTGRGKTNALTASFFSFHKLKSVPSYFLFSLLRGKQVFNFAVHGFEPREKILVKLLLHFRHADIQDRFCLWRQ